MDCSPPGSSVHGISQARILEQVAISFCRGASWPRDRTHVSCIGRRILYHWAIREAQDIIASIIRCFPNSHFSFFFADTISVLLCSTIYSEKARRVDLILRSLGNTTLIPEVIPLESDWITPVLVCSQPVLWKIRPRTKNLELHLIVIKNSLSEREKEVLNQPVSGCPQSPTFVREQNYRPSLLDWYKLRPLLRITLWPVWGRCFVVLRKEKAEIYGRKNEGRTCSDYQENFQIVFKLCDYKCEGGYHWSRKMLRLFCWDFNFCFSSYQPKVIADYGESVFFFFIVGASRKLQFWKEAREDISFLFFCYMLLYLHGILVTSGSTGFWQTGNDKNERTKRKISGCWWCPWAMN